MRKFCFSIIFGLIVICSGAAGESKTKSGVAIQSFMSDGWLTAGFMVGARFIYYQKTFSNLNFGWEMMAGVARGGAVDSDNLTYGGLTVGYDGTIAKIFMFDLSVLLGGAMGRVERFGAVGHGVIVQPQAAIGLTLIEGYRASAGVGYLFFPNVPQMSAGTFTIRLEHKELGNSSGDNG